MNPYDDDPSARRRGRADEYPGGVDDRAPRPAGRASVGRASVPGAVSPANGYSTHAERDPYSGSAHQSSGYDPFESGGYGSAGNGSAGHASSGYGSGTVGGYESPSRGYESSGYDSRDAAYDSPRRSRRDRHADSYAADSGGARYDSGYGQSHGLDPYGPTYDPQVRDAYPGAPAGRPTSPSGVGRATVGRASVRPTSPGAAGVSSGAAPLGPGVPPAGTPGGPALGRGRVGLTGAGAPGAGGPGGPGGPGGTGPGGPRGPWGPRRPFGREPGDGEPAGWRRFGTGMFRATNGKRSSRARWRNIAIASFAVFIMLTGAGFVGGTYYVGSIEPTDELEFPKTTTLYYSDGKTEMFKLGEITRYPLQFDEMNDAVVMAIVASEDKTFWTNEGVDFFGVMRAAWNNFTGGATQGGSTITQQYARLAYDLHGATYARKLREAVLAWKMSDQLSKEEILANYLNSVPFGRGTHGIEAAAKSYFGKTARKDAPEEQQLTLAEAMVLVSMVKQPEPHPTNPLEYPGYDPTLKIDGEPVPKAEENARSRFEYVREQLSEVAQANPQPPGGRQLVYPTPEEIAALEFPPLESFKERKPDVRIEQPIGLVKNHVFSELTNDNPNSPFNGINPKTGKEWTWKEIEQGGYKIVTTIDKRVQAVAEKYANQKSEDSPLNGEPDNLEAALVAVEPGTGRVLGYYGGPDGTDVDYAGIYFDENGEGAGHGRHPPGSSFKVYTLAAALKAGYSLNSYWRWTPHEMPGRAKNNPVRNASSCKGDRANRNNPDAPPCSLLQSTIDSLNVPFYELTVSLGVGPVLEMARDAGIDYMWDDTPEQGRHKLLGQDISTLAGTFGYEIGIGQYPITPMDHANGMATMAAGGLRATAHFVREVRDVNDKMIYSETIQTDGPRILNQPAVNDLTYALSQVGAARVSGLAWDTAGKTGTWQYGNSMSENAHAWMVGYTRKIGVAVWVGAEKGGPIRQRDGSSVFGSELGGPIWQKFMREVHQVMADEWPRENTRWNPPNFIGIENPPLSVPSPTPPPPPTDEPPFPGFPTIPPITIEPPPGGGDGGGPGGGDGGGRGGGGGGGGDRFIVPRTTTSPP